MSLLDLHNINGAFFRAEDLPRIDSKKIWEHIETNLCQQSWNEAWNEVEWQWLNKLRGDLGAQYSLIESNYFCLLSPLSKEKQQELLKFLESLFVRLQGIIENSSASTDGRFGKELVLLFDDENDYFRYISHFFPDGNHPISAGVFIHDNPCHIAAPVDFGICGVLTHELVHSLLAHLPIPIWLNEGLAVTFENDFGMQRGFVLDPETAARQHEHWGLHDIQEFWSGKSFNDLEASDVSYSFAAIVIQLLSGEKGNFRDFLSNAHYLDAGEEAAIKCYGKSLGVIAGIFLGEGEWKPILEIIASHHNTPAEG